MEAIRSALIETLRFLIVEEGWEGFRAEFLFVKDGEQQAASASARNADKLRRFLRDLAAKDDGVRECVEEASKAFD